jgi:hypothetical protein
MLPVNSGANLLAPTAGLALRLKSPPNASSTSVIENVTQATFKVKLDEDNVAGVHLPIFKNYADISNLRTLLLPLHPHSPKAVGRPLAFLVLPLIILPYDLQRRSCTVSVGVVSRCGRPAIPTSRPSTLLSSLLRFRSLQTKLKPITVNII